MIPSHYISGGINIFKYLNLIFDFDFLPSRKEISSRYGDKIIILLNQLKRFGNFSAEK